MDPTSVFHSFTASPAAKKRRALFEEGSMPNSTTTTEDPLTNMWIPSLLLDDLEGTLLLPCKKSPSFYSLRPRSERALLAPRWGIMDLTLSEKNAARSPAHRHWKDNQKSLR
jgi:hypothetical protein